MSLALACALFLGLQGTARAEVVERIAAVVNDEIILYSELLDQAQSFESLYASLPDEAARQAKRHEVLERVLDELIDDHLLTQQIKELKIKVSETEIDEAIHDIMSRNKLDNLDDFKQLLTRQGMEWRAYREEIGKQLRRNQFIQAKVGMRIKISDEEVREAYEKETSMATREYEFRARHILFKATKTDSADLLNAQRAKAEQTRARALSGENFDQLAQSLSESPDSRFGGDLGYFQKGVMVREFEDAVNALEVGGISPVVRTPFGFHVIKLEDKRPLPGKEFEEVKEVLRGRLREEAAAKEMKTWLKQLRQKAFISNRLDVPTKKPAPAAEAKAPVAPAPKATPEKTTEAKP